MWQLLRQISGDSSWVSHGRSTTTCFVRGLGHLSAPRLLILHDLDHTWQGCVATVSGMSLQSFQRVCYSTETGMKWWAALVSTQNGGSPAEQGEGLHHRWRAAAGKG